MNKKSVNGNKENNGGEIGIVKKDEIKHLFKYMQKEHVSLNVENTILFGYKIDNKVIGVVGFMYLKNSIRYKCDFVLENYRNKGIYTSLFKTRDIYCKGKFDYISAFCTKYSLNTYLRNGFNVVKEGKISFVKRYE